MNDRDFLIWLHERLCNVHGENELYDYMHSLRRIIASTPADRRSNEFGHNSLEDLKKHLNP